MLFESRDFHTRQPGFDQKDGIRLEPEARHHQHEVGNIGVWYDPLCAVEQVAFAVLGCAQSDSCRLRAAVFVDDRDRSIGAADSQFGQPLFGLWM